MSQNAVRRLYLMQVGMMPLYGIPIVCYLVQTDDVLPQLDLDFTDLRS